MDNEISFFKHLEHSFRNKTLVRITLSNPSYLTKDSYQKVLIKPAIIKKKRNLSFVFRYTSKDITKNHLFDEAIVLIKKMWTDEFDTISLFCTKKDWNLNRSNGQIKSLESSPSFSEPAQLSHDKIKKTPSKNTNYLKELGILNASGMPNASMGDKLKQIRKYTEILDHQFQKAQLYNKPSLSIVDMGCGKGYLSFALTDLLKSKYKGEIKFTGIELRKKLVDKCNSIAQKINFNELNFECKTIQEYKDSKIDVLIALHACDTATDDAIYKGIESNADLIVVAPCCHKQVRKAMSYSEAIEDITKHGILFERQAEIITDTIRALILEKHAYDTKVFEFISNEHTSKNLMIVASKKENIEVELQNKIQSRIDKLKDLTGLNFHYLERLVT